MSILTWLRRSQAGQSPATMEFAESERHFGGLDMKAAIDAHVAWKTRLEAQIRGNAGEALEVATVAADCNCALGKWLHGEGKRQFGLHAEYGELRKAHAEFHLCAGKILSDAHDGNAAAAADALKKELRHHSDAVQLALVRLYARAHGHH